MSSTACSRICRQERERERGGGETRKTVILQINNGKGACDEKCSEAERDQILLLQQQYHGACQNATSSPPRRIQDSHIIHLPTSAPSVSTRGVNCRDKAPETTSTRACMHPRQPTPALARKSVSCHDSILGADKTTVFQAPLPPTAVGLHS